MNELQSRRFLPLCGLLALVATSAMAAPAVVMFPAIGRSDSVTISGRVYKDAGTSGSSTLSRNLRRLTASNWEGAPVEIRFEGTTYNVNTGNDGVFSVTLTPKAGKAFPPGIRFVELVAGEKAASARGAVEIVSDQAPFIVVSDFDDTLAISNVTSKRKVIETALFKDSTSQEVVPGMSRFYGCLKNEKKATPGFALVSGSPEQFVPRAAMFLSHHEFPFFGMYLRNWGPNTLSGYKQPHIKRLMDQFKDHQFILVGDSGEHDPEVYQEIRAAYPDRVAAIYIRNAGRTEDVSRFDGMVLFDDARKAAEDAKGKGLLSAKCFEKAFPQAN